MSLSKLTIILFMLSVFAGFSFAQENMEIQGVWEMVSQTYDGNSIFTSGRQIKAITKDHYFWVYQDKEQTQSLLNKNTHEDSLMAYAAAFHAGSGTYKLAGNTCTETPEFVQGGAEYIGLPIEFTLKVRGDSLFQSGKLPVMEGNKKVNEFLLEESYKRIE